MGPIGASITQQHDGFEFAGYTLDLDRAALIKDGVDQNLRPQVFDVLRYLVERSGSLVTKEELQAEIWGDKAVTDDSLTHCVIEIRKALNDTDRRIIRTVPRRGFVLDVPVRRHSPQQTVVPQRPARIRPAHLAALIVLAVAATYALVPANDKGKAAPAIAADVTDYYAQAMFLFQRRAAGDLDSAHDYFQKAIELDPGSAKAWAGLAGVFRLRSYENAENDDYLEKLKAAAETAISLDPENGAAWMRLAQYYYVIDDVQAKERAYSMALRVDPNDPLVLGSTAGRLARNGDFRAAVEFERRAVALQPLSFVSRGNLAGYLFAAGDYEAAMHESRRAHQMRPATPDNPDVLPGFALNKLGRHEEALELVRDWPDGPDKLAVRAMSSHALGREMEAARAIEQLLDRTDNDTRFRLAEVEAFCDRVDNSFAQLTEIRGDLVGGVDPADVDEWLFRIRMSPFLAAVREDPRWQGWAQRTYDLAIAANVRPTTD